MPQPARAAAALAALQCTSTACTVHCALKDLASTTMTDHYAALGLAANATLADIKKAFRQRAALHHPDRSNAPDAAERFRAVQTAYAVLSDPQARQDYDDNRRRNLLDDPLLTAQDIWQTYFKSLALP